MGTLRSRLPSAQLREAHEAAERILCDSSRLPLEPLEACPLFQEPECLEHVYADDSITDVAERETGRPASMPVPFRHSADEEFGQDVHTAIRKVEDMG